MIIGIYGAGQFVPTVNKEIPFIAVDGGIISLNKLNITPSYVVGDFDSSRDFDLNQYKNVIQLPCRKDFSDTEVAIQYAVELGYNEIELYGVTGGRLDHFYAISRLLVKYKDVKISVIDNLNKIYLLHPGNHIIDKGDYDYISFYSVTKSLLTLKGVEYPLDSYLLEYDCALCLSNEIKNKQCEVMNDAMIYCIQSKKGVF